MHDLSSWPVSNRQQTIVQRNITKQADPLEKDGIIGAFNRTYTVTQAIDTFISEVYKPSTMTGRYDYVPADSSAGVVFYEDKFVYSHHATDPACGKLMNAFDVIRIHRFGNLDAKASEDTDSVKLPSFKAMQEFITKDDKVKVTLAKEREASAKNEFFDLTDDEDWQSKLSIDRQGKIKDTLTNIATIIRFDKNLQSIVYNQLKNSVDVIGGLPWSQVKKGWGDADLACAKLYFERVYGLWSPTKFKDALLAVISSERLYPSYQELF